MMLEYKASMAVRAGLYHKTHGMSCQDRVAVHRENGVVCVALADGAGSREHSAVGAELVTQHIVKLLCQNFREVQDMADTSAVHWLKDSCIQKLLQLEHPLRELACTLLFFAAQEDGTFLSGHLGDGIQISIKHRVAEVFSLPENGEYQNETYFITGQDAADHLRMQKGTLSESGGLLMMSDGMAESLYQRRTGRLASACQQMVQWLQEGEETAISQALENNMERIFSKHSEDDLSLVLLTWNEAPHKGERSNG